MVRSRIPSNVTAVSLAEIASRGFLDDFNQEAQEARYESPDGNRSRCVAALRVTPRSILIAFGEVEPLAIGEREYGGPLGRIVAANATWEAAEVSYSGRSTNAENVRIFDCARLTTGQRPEPAEVAATRLIFAGAAWAGEASLASRRLLIRPLSLDAASHHDMRLGATIERELDPRDAETVERTLAFISGCDLQLLCTERYDPNGWLIDVVHTRGFKRVGRAPHSPFETIERRNHALDVLVNGVQRRAREGFPLDMILDLIASSNTVHQIHLGGAFLMLAVQTAVHHWTAELKEFEETAPTDRRRYVRALGDLRLGLSSAHVDRLTALRTELLETGYFHQPDYSTGRPQRDIKFIRDIAHTIVFRLCGYAGPYFGSEAQTVREFPA